MPRRRNHGRAIPIGPEVTSEVGRIVPPERLRVTRVQIAWPFLAIGALRAAAWPASIRGETLTLVVIDHQWLHELVYLQADLLRRIQTSVPEAAIERLRSRVGPVPKAWDPEPEEKEPELHSMSNEPDPQTLEALASIEDPVLKQAIANARMAWSERVRRRWTEL